MKHLELEQLTSFAARYHLAKHARDHGQTPKDANVLTMIKAVADNMSVDEQTRLADNFNRLRKVINEERKRSHGLLSLKLANSLNELVKSLRNHTCKKCFEDKQCSEEKEYWCKPNGETYDNIHSRGACIAPLKALFKELHEWVGSLWRDLASNAGMPSLPVIVFSTRSPDFHEDDAEPIIEEFDIGGFALSECDDDGAFYTQVGLVIRRNAFDWPQYSILPYILLHEILCHAFQSLGRPTSRPNAEPSDAWSEGWMDCVAYELAQEWLEQSKHFHTKKECRDARRQTTELHNARYPKRRSEGDLHTGNGRDIFYAVLDSYGKRYDHLSRSRHPVTRFSLRLNAIPMLAEERIPHLLKLQNLAEHAPAELHTLIGAINAETDDEAVKALLA
jgi:hypothetical protein